MTTPQPETIAPRTLSPPELAEEPGNVPKACRPITGRPSSSGRSRADGLPLFGISGTKPAAVFQGLAELSLAGPLIAGEHRPDGLPPAKLAEHLHEPRAVFSYPQKRDPGCM